MSDVEERTSKDGIRRYTVGKFVDISAARSMQSKMRNSGYADAFITGYANGEKVPVQKIPELLKN